MRANRGCCRFPWSREGWFSGFPKGVCKEIESACKVHLHDGAIADRGELGFLEISRGPAQGREAPGPRVVSWLTAKVAQIIPPALVREREPEFYRDGKERRRQFLKATELNNVCFRLWLRERLRPSEQIKPSVVYILVGTQLPRLSEIGFSGIN